MNTATAAPSPAPAITRRKLSHAEILKLYPWYEKNQSRFLTMKDAEILAEADAALQIPGLKESHLQGVRTTLGIQRPKPAPPPSGDLAALEGLVNEQADQIVRLTNITQNLLDRVRKLEAAGR